MNEPVITVSNVSKKYNLISSATKFETFFAEIAYKVKNTIIRKDKSKKIEEFLALSNINFNVNKGERIGIIGHNGAGKSTLLKIFSRITTPTEGVIKIKGRVSSLLEVGTGFHQELTGRENIYLNGAILGMTKEEIDKKFSDIVEFSEIGVFIDTPVKRYSSGMYVRLAFAVAAHLDPDILIVDEVLAVGDMKFQQKCLGKMEDITGGGRTVLYVSHNMNTIQQLCNRVIVLDHGKIIYDGNVDEGIKVYMENTKEMQIFNDLSTIKRMENDISGHAKMLSLEILDKDSCMFYSDETLKFIIKWRADKELQNICMRMIILYADNTPAGMMTTRPLINAKDQGIIETNFETDISYLAPGKYISKLVFYSVNEYGTFANIDVVENAFTFEMMNKNNEANNLTWLHRWWGHISFPEIRVKS